MASNATVEAPTAALEEQTSKDAKTRPETWEDWLPPEVPPDAVPTITREAMLDHLLHRRNIAVTSRQLHYWEAEGLLPYPVRKHHEGAMYAFYPVWHYEVVAEIARRYQQPRGRRPHFADVRATSRERFAEWCRGYQLYGFRGRGESQGANDLSPELFRVLRETMIRMKANGHGDITTAEVRFLDQAGQPTASYTIAGFDREHDPLALSVVD